MAAFAARLLQQRALLQFNAQHIAKVVGAFAWLGIPDRDLMAAVAARLPPEDF